MTENKAVTLNVEGMTCSNCALGISRHLQHKGLQKVNTNFATGEVTFLPEKSISIDQIIKDINELGYRVVDTGINAETQTRSIVETRFYIALIFTIPLFSHMFLPLAVLHNPWVQLILAVPVMIIGLMHFGKSAWGSVKARVPNMDVLITVGSVAAFIYSVVGLIKFGSSHEVHNYLFFETAATIITLVLLGNVLEHRSVKQTTTAIGELTKMQPALAKIIISNNGEEMIREVEVKTVNKEDILLINSGDKIPVDGLIISGNALIDESMITGESLPSEKKPGDMVIGGTIVETGNFRIKATSVGNETVLSKIIDLVKNAQNDKPNIQKLGDQVSAIFVPVVLIIAFLTFAAWYFYFFDQVQPDKNFTKVAFSMMAAIAVLVISCPCAMGLATPTAVMAGIGRAAKSGILIKGGNTLEEFAKVHTVVFDKTGTLTTGNFKIKQINPLAEETIEAIHGILFSIEQNSSHPIARSIVNELQQVQQSGNVKPVVLKNLHEEKGYGMKATDEAGNEYEAGSYKIAEKYTLDDSHTIYLIKNKKLIATIDLEDEIKINAKETIDSLKQQGIKVVMISGDRKEKCRTLSRELGIDEFYAEQLPHQKLELIEKLSAKKGVAMVGDGINDAPALAKANIGISLGNATEVAIHASQIVLLNGKDLMEVDNALKLSKATLKTIKQNLFWAFFYNVFAIPVAAMGLLSPMIGALAMAFSDVIVIGNSIRLKSRKLD